MCEVPMDKPKAATDKSRFLTAGFCKDRFRHAGCIHIFFFESFAPFSHMLYFQRTIKLYIYQLAVNGDGEK